MPEKARPIVWVAGATRLVGSVMEFDSGSIDRVGGRIVYTPAGGGGGGAPTNAQYLTLALDGTLTAERRFVPALPLSATDGGANGDYTLSLSGWSGTTDGDLLYRNGTAVGTKTPAQARTWLDLATYYQPLDADLTAYAAISSTGLVARTGAGAVAARTLTAPAAGITVSNGDGVSGNPTLSLANDLAALEGLSSTGIAVRTATDTWAQRSLVAGDGVTITNGDGVSGNPIIEAGAGSFPDPTAKLFYYWRTAKNSINYDGPSTTLTALADGTTDTYNATLCNSTGTTSHAGPNCSAMTRLGHDGTMSWRVRTTTITNKRLKVGYFTGTHAGSPDTPTTGGYYMLFRASSAIPDTNWQIVHGTGTASAYTTTDTGIPWSANTSYDFTITTSSSGVAYTVVKDPDGTPTSYSGTVSTNNPTAATNIGWTVACTSTTGTQTLEFFGAYYTADHP